MRWKAFWIAIPFAAAFGQTCSLPATPVIPRGPTIFTPEQEGYLGEAAAQQMRRQIAVYPKPELNAMFDRIAGRILPYLPGGEYHFQFALIELAQANAFALPGGRIFVSRKLVQFVKNEDELAGVLAHEMGHVIARQSSVDLSKRFTDVLKVTSVSDRRDVFDKFNRLLDLASKGAKNSHTEDDQTVADRVSLQAAWRAGYDPEAIAQFLDRLTDNKGVTGNFFTDFLGETKPVSKRIREILKEGQSLTAGCRQAPEANQESAFRAWQKSVSELSPEDLVPSSATRKAAFTLPHLQPGIENIRFAPDGKLLIAQDESGIDVVQRDPLKFLFRVPARLASGAVISADSKHLVFASPGNRVEVWSLESGLRERRWEADDSLHCVGLTPSADGRVAGCVSEGAPRIVRLIDLETSAEIVHHELPLVRPLTYHMTFSLDGSEFIASNSAIQFPPWAYNLSSHSEIPLKGALKAALTANPGYFAFLNSERVLASNVVNPKESGLFSLTDGKLTKQISMPETAFRPAAKGLTVIFKPKDYAVGALSLEEQKVFQVSRAPAMDFYDDIEGAERRTGELALYSGGKTQPFAVLELPNADLARWRSSGFSEDLRFVAVSINSRSAIWDLMTGRSVLANAFVAPHISKEGLFTATFDATEPGKPGEGDKKYLTRETLDISTGKRVSSNRLPEAEKGRTITYSGSRQITVQAGPSATSKSSLEVKDIESGKELWSLQLDPPVLYSIANSLVLRYPAASPAAEQMAKDFPALKGMLESVQKTQDVAVLDLRDLDTGKRLGGVAVEGGAGNAIRGVRLAGRTVFVEEANNRTLAYSLDTGERLGQQFGPLIAINSTRGLVALENQPGEIEILDSSMQSLASFSYPGYIIHSGFDKDGKRFEVVTSRQEVFLDPVP